MKRRDLIRYLENNGCEFLREGGNHTIYVNRRAQKSSAIPPLSRDHRLCRKKDLQRPGHSEAVSSLSALSCPAVALAKEDVPCAALTFVP